MTVTWGGSCAGYGFPDGAERVLASIRSRIACVRFILRMNKVGKYIAIPVKINTQAISHIMTFLLV